MKATQAGQGKILAEAEEIEIEIPPANPCRRGYATEVMCQADDRPLYSGGDRCAVCKRGGNL